MAAASRTNRARKPATATTPEAALAEGDQVTGMAEVYEEIEASLTPASLKERLFTPRLAEREVPLEVGAVRVRALSRDEMAELREDHSDDDGNLVDRKGFEYALIAKAMVNPAAMTPEDVARWAKAAPGGELIQVLTAVNALSGLDDVDGAKSVPANRQQRRAAVRARTRA